MYKQLKITEKITITLEKFSATRKKLSPVYKTGIRSFRMEHYRVFSFVVGNFRIMFTFEGKELPVSQG